MRRTSHLLNSLVSFLFVSCGDRLPGGLVTNKIEGPEALLAKVERAYETRDIELFASLFANPDIDGVGYRQMHVDGEQWDYAEEIRAHARMFDLAKPESGQPAVPHGLRLEGVAIDITPLEAFVEAVGYYANAENPDGLDRARWKAMQAECSTHVQFSTQQSGRVDVRDRSRIVIIEDLEASRFLIYRWVSLTSASSNQAPQGP